LVMFGRSSSKNPARLLEIDHAGSKLLIPIYIFSIVDIVFVFAVYSGVFG
jgi:hypothetical protein